MIPTSLEEVTPAFLTEALGAGDVGAAACEVIGEDRGFTGVVARCTIHFREFTPEAPGSVVVKLPMGKREQMSGYLAGQQTGPAFEQARFQQSAQEVRFYREVGIGIAPGSTSAPSLPHVYHAAADEAHLRVVLVMEDLQTGREGDALTGCTPEEAWAVLAAIAPLHARWWSAPHPADLDRLPRGTGEIAERQARFRERTTHFGRRYADRLTPALAELVRELRDGYGETLEQLARAPITIIHADLHLDNVVFREDEGGISAILLDWQNVARGPAVLDLPDVLLATLKQGSIRHEVDDLAAEYHADLIRQGVGSYPLEQLRSDLRLAMRQHAAGTIGWLGRPELAFGFDRERALADAAFDDLHQVATLLA